MQFSMHACFTAFVVICVIQDLQAGLYYSNGICAGAKKDKFPLPGAKDDEKVEITFECDGSVITYCNLPNMDRVRQDRQREQTYVGQDGREYTVVCWSGYEPEVRENFSANVCASDDKTAAIEFPRVAQKPISVKFDCDGKLIKACKPEGFGKISPGGSVTITGPNGKGKFHLDCNQKSKPSTWQTFAEEICPPSEKYYSFGVGKDSRRIDFECNDENDKIVSCKPKGYRHRVLNGDKHTYGWFSNKFTLYCDDTSKPTFS